MYADSVIPGELSLSNESLDKFKSKLAAASGPYYIVSIDDEADIVEIVSDSVKPMKISPKVFTNPLDVSDFVKANSKNVMMILSDYKMPSMTGFELRKKLVDLGLGHIPFVILSAHVDKEMALSAVDLKISAFLEKPFNLEAILDCVLKFGAPRLDQLLEEAELLAGFLDDSVNIIEQIEEIMLGLEANPTDTESLTRLYGLIHTMKGTSGFFDPKTLHKFIHKFEDQLKKVQSGLLPLNADFVSKMLKTLDVIKILVSEFKSGNHKDYVLDELCQVFLASAPVTTANETKKSEVQAAGKVQTPTQQEANDIRVAISVLDDFMRASGDMTVIRNMINKTVRSIEKQYRSDKDVQKLITLLEELHKINASVQTKVSDLRKIPVKTTIKPLQRIVRDTAKNLGKDVDFRIEGESVRIDTSLADALNKSLPHMVRNSLDHGIEDNPTRQKLGKPNKGTLALRFRIESDFVNVELEDDGKGINPEIIKKKLLTLNYTPDQISRMSRDEIVSMIFSPGFSTAEKVTELSGRGVGTSMVKDSIEGIGGSIRIQTEVGKGTLFLLKLPVPKSVHILSCLLVEVSGQIFGIPQNSIIKVLSMTPENRNEYIRGIPGGETLAINNEILPILNLNKILGLDIKGESKGSHVLVIQTAAKSKFAVTVEKVLDIEDSVVRPLPGGLRAIGQYSGASFLDDGRVGLILNPDQLSSSQPRGNSKVEDLRARVPLKRFLQVKGSTDELFAIQQDLVFRIEDVANSKFQKSGNQDVLVYREEIMPVFSLDALLTRNSSFDFESHQTQKVIVFRTAKGFSGLHVRSILDMVETDEANHPPLKQVQGIEGVIKSHGKLMTILDPVKMFSQFFKVV